MLTFESTADGIDISLRIDGSLYEPKSSGYIDRRCEECVLYKECGSLEHFDLVELCDIVGDYLQTEHNFKRKEEKPC